MGQTEILPHLFRTEFSKITAVLCRHSGIEHLEWAEDIASETFLAALETWTYKGIPENPRAWLYAVARNKARNQLTRKQVFEQKIAGEIRMNLPAWTETTPDLSDQNISDSQLQMLFAVCHPAVPAEAQVGLALRVLCGFGIDEIATAFLSNKETINKRLFRAKEKLRAAKVPLEMPGPQEMGSRLGNVLTTLYLLFNEGYYSESHDQVLREELCLEAMRLAYLLLEHEASRQPPVYALLSLMCFHASRFPARRSAGGEFVLYADQDESLWNQDLIRQGVFFLNKAASGNSLSSYHLEASIAYWHTVKADTKEKWENILQGYNRLLQLHYSPVIALNRTYALFKANGKAEALAAAEQLKLEDNHYYHTLLGEVCKEEEPAKARLHFSKALSLARTQADKKELLKKISLLP